MSEQWGSLGISGSHNLACRVHLHSVASDRLCHVPESPADEAAAAALAALEAADAAAAADPVEK